MAKSAPSVTIVEANIVRIEHCGTTASGNLTYVVTLADGRTYKTAPDGQVGSKIENYAPAYGGKSRVRLSIKHGRIINITNLDGSDR